MKRSINEVGVELGSNLDIGMFVMPTSVQDLCSINAFWTSGRQPPYIVYKERPGYLQLCHGPLGLFIPTPTNMLLQDLKIKLCDKLHAEGAEVPLPTSDNLCKDMLVIYVKCFT